MHEIVKDGIVMARHITQDDVKAGLNFYSLDQEYIQVGVWGHYERGKELQTHMHNKFQRNAERTYEALYVISGSVEAAIYDLEKNKVDNLLVKQGEILILLECAHGYKITSEDTTVLEIKNGPYAGAEKDRTRI